MHKQTMQLFLDRTYNPSEGPLGCFVEGGVRMSSRAFLALTAPQKGVAEKGGSYNKVT